MERSSCGGT
uniref:Uncharacterized protein n=1 Tax=Rhizophora mucronata TaxID=61149 RepID=A0A2P2KA14_RHIMU